MGLFGFAKRGAVDAGGTTSIERRLAPEGAAYLSKKPTAWEDRDPSRFGAERELAAFLFQAEDEGHARIEDDAIFLAWSDVFRLMESPEHAESFPLLGLPRVEPWRPVLASSGTLTDEGFSIHLAGWRAPDGSFPKGDAVKRHEDLTP